MIPSKFEEEVRSIAYNDGVECRDAGLSEDANEWMPGTIFYDDWMDGYNS